jgi:hypothetical protein
VTLLGQYCEASAMAARKALRLQQGYDKDALAMWKEADRVGELGHAPAAWSAIAPRQGQGSAPDDVGRGISGGTEARAQAPLGGMMDDHPLSPAVVRLYARAMEIEREVEELIEDGDYLSIEELLPWLKRPPKQRAAEEAKAKARRLGQHRQYQWIKRELARLLGLGPADLHPLDFKSKRKLPLDDPRWRRAMWLSTLKGKEVHTVAGVRVKYRDGSLVD